MAYTNPYFGGYYPPQMQPMYPNGGAMPDMLSQFKGQFQQPQMAPQNQTTPQQLTNDMIWVLGEVEATSYPVAPGNTVVLWDKDQTVIYIKSVNAQGVPSMRILDYAERTLNAPRPSQSVEPSGGKYVSEERFSELESRMNALQEKLESMNTKPKTKGVTDNG